MARSIYRVNDDEIVDSIVTFGIDGISLDPDGHDMVDICNSLDLRIDPIEMYRLIARISDIASIEVGIESHPDLVDRVRPTVEEWGSRLVGKGRSDIESLLFGHRRLER